MSCLRHFDIFANARPWATFLRCIAKFKFDILESLKTPIMSESSAVGVPKSDFQRLALLSPSNVGSHASRSISERLSLPLTIKWSKTRTRMRLFVTMKRSLTSRRSAWITWTLRKVNSMHQWRCKSCGRYILPCQDLIRSRTLHYTRKRISEFSNRRTQFVKVRWLWSSWLI